MILAHHPRVAAEDIRTLQGNPDTPSLAEAAGAARDLEGVMGFQPPSWEAMAWGARPNVRELDDCVRGSDSRGWQHEASFRVEELFRQEQVFPAAYLPVWPSTRLFWPSPSSVRTGWGPRKNAVRIGEHPRPHLS